MNMSGPDRIPVASFSLPVFPFYYPRVPSDRNDIFFKRFDCRLYFHAGTGLMAQSLSLRDQEEIEKIYKKGSMIYNVAECRELNVQEGIHLKLREESFLQQFFSIFEEDAVASFDILEVGCGSGHLLNEMKKRGANVIGCDVGPYGEAARRNFDIDIIREPFSDDIFGSRTFDIVYSFAFLEHVPNPVETVRRMGNLLKKGGKILNAVPDCTSHLNLGNPFCITPEHLNYFTRDSIVGVYRATSLQNVEVRSSEYGFGLFAYGEKGDEQQHPTEVSIGCLRDESIAFKHRSERFLKRLQDRIGVLAGKSVGLMGGGIETAALLSLLDFRGVSFRVYEVDKSFVGKYLPSVEIPISCESQVIQDGPDEIWIIPLAYCDKIEHKIKNEFKMNTPLLNLKTVLEETRIPVTPEPGSRARGKG